MDPRAGVELDEGGVGEGELQHPAGEERGGRAQYGHEEAEGEASEEREATAQSKDASVIVP